jgi:hypothetical protein
MKRTLFIASVIGLFMATTLNLQAHQRRHFPPRPVRAGFAVAALTHAPLAVHRYNHQLGRQATREIRNNDRRIWKLEQRINMLDRYRGNRREIRELEYEIERLQRRNDFLRSRLY